MSKPLTEKPEVIRDAVRALGPAATLAEGIVQQAALAYARTLDALRATDVPAAEGLRARIEALPVYRYVLPTDDEATPSRGHRPFDMLRRDAVLAALRSTDVPPGLRERVRDAVAVHVGSMRADVVADDVMAVLAATPTRAPAEDELP